MNASKHKKTLMTFLTQRTNYELQKKIDARQVF